MKVYYRMSERQKNTVPTENINCEPYSNLVGEEWIVECNVQGLECITEYSSNITCREYVNDHIHEWDEFHDV